MTHTSRELRPERALLHPAWLGALALLVANDHFLKGAGILHHVATGKLSDFAGMIVAPVLLAALLRVGTRRGLVAAHLAVAIVFALTEISPACADLLAGFMTAAGVPWRLVPDLTDLLALPMLLVSWRCLVPAMESPVAPRTRAVQLLRVSAATVGFLACVGTSKAPEPEMPPPPPSAPPAPAAMVAAPASAASLEQIVGHRWLARNEDGTWQLSYRFETDGRYRANGVPTFEESGRIELLTADGATLRIRLVDRVSGGGAEQTDVRDLVLSPDGQSFTMNGDTFVQQSDAVVIEDGGE